MHSVGSFEGSSQSSRSLGSYEKESSDDNYQKQYSRFKWADIFEKNPNLWENVLKKQKNKIPK